MNTIGFTLLTWGQGLVTCPLETRQASALWDTLKFGGFLFSAGGIS